MSEPADLIPVWLRELFFALINLPKNIEANDLGSL